LRRGGLPGLRICRWCLGRLHSSDPDSAALLGSELAARLGMELDDAGCQLCGGIFASIDGMAEEAAAALRGSGAEVGSFYVSVEIPRSSADLEDELRSGLRLSGGISAKRLAIRLLTRALGARLGIPARAEEPDAVLSFSPRGFRGLSLSPLYVEGRYLKPAGERTRCIGRGGCGGTGRVSRDFTGASGEPASVERAIEEHLRRAFGAEGVTITWTGTDREHVEVAGRGRPFLAKLSGAKRRASWVMEEPHPRIASLRLIGGRREAELRASRTLYDVVEAYAELDRDAEELAGLVESMEGTELRTGVRGRIVARALARAEGRALAAAICAEHGADLRSALAGILGVGAEAVRLRVVDVVEDCEGYPLRPPGKGFNARRPPCRQLAQAQGTPEEDQEPHDRGGPQGALPPHGGI